MSFLLCLETSSKNCSVAIFKNDKCISLVEKSSDKYIHAEMLNHFINWALEAIDIDFTDLSAIVLSAGPGSYTGLRIGASCAKAFCFALDIPLIAVDTLASLARSAKTEHHFDYVMPCMDARRDEIYCAVYDDNFKNIEPTQALVLNKNFFKNYQNFLLIGDGAKKTQAFLNPLEVKIQENLPSAATLGLIGYEKFLNKSFEDVAYFEPAYLKKFVNNIKK